jgi:hypothetical protein
VVPVFATSCQVSEKPRNGPVQAHAAITTHAPQKAHGEPAARATVAENLRKKFMVD